HLAPDAVAMDVTREEVLLAIDHAVEQLLEQAGVAAPPVDAIVLAQRHLGMTVCLDEREQQRARAQRAGQRKQIFLRPEPSEERHQWTVAHEIGEHLKPGLLHRLGLDTDRTSTLLGESLPNRFASQLLLPTCWFEVDARELDYDVPALKQRYHTASHQVVALRFLDLPEGCVITILDNDEIARRQSNAWRIKAGELEPAEV